MINTILLQAGAAQGGGIQTLLMLGLVFVVFYFFMIRPQMKKQKELRNFRNELAKGDKIITTGGIYGRIAEIKDTYMVVEVCEGTKIKVDKNAILKDSADLAQQK
ncbi:MAG: preprotein translocase subunit YajC [Bacteroidales bacterium]|nr:preprotein translocase subunit YajC [Bacteroidales bacterium]